MDNLARTLLVFTRRVTVNKTGLSGTYRVAMNFAAMAAFLGPDATAPAADAPSSVFTAIQEQLGLKLESSRVLNETLVIDRLERPTEN